MCVDPCRRMQVATRADEATSTISEGYYLESTATKKDASACRTEREKRVRSGARSVVAKIEGYATINKMQ